MSDDGPHQGHDWRPARFMVIVAHPDDADFGPAATCARWISEGSEGWLVCCTSGDQGGEDPDIDPLELAATREAEQRTAMAAVGYAGVTFLHQPDGALANDLALREQLVREIRTFRPDAILGDRPGDGLPRPSWREPHRPSRGRDGRGRRCLPGVPQPMAFPWLARAGLAAHRVRRLYLFWSNQPDAWVDVTAMLDRKFDALRAHASQIEDMDALFARVRERAAEAGATIGVTAAEAFRVIVIDEDEADDEAAAEEVAETADTA